jgi:hypothetical protein
MRGFFMPETGSSTQNVQVDAYPENHSVSPLALRERVRVRGCFHCRNKP